MTAQVKRANDSRIPLLAIMDVLTQCIMVSGQEQVLEERARDSETSRAQRRSQNRLEREHVEIRAIGSCEVVSKWD